jgi:hypothetical protein
LSPRYRNIIHLLSLFLLLGLYVHIHGEAKTNWSEERHRGTNNSTSDHRDNSTATDTIHYRGLDVYLDSTTYLFGQANALAKSIQPGVHQYNFAVALPEALPSSIKCKNGSIEYYIEAVLDVPWFFDKKFKMPFTVERFDNLSLQHEYQLPVAVEDVKTFCCLLCASPPLMTNVEIPRSGYAKGESIPVKICYVNKSSIQVQRTGVKLMRKISYKADWPHHKIKKSSEVVAETFVDGVSGKRSVDLSTKLNIPLNISNSNEKFSRIIQISYAVVIEGVVSGCRRNTQLEIPITIGSTTGNFQNFVPFRESTIFFSINKKV